MSTARDLEWLWDRAAGPGVMLYTHWDGEHWIATVTLSGGDRLETKEKSPKAATAALRAAVVTKDRLETKVRS